MLSQLKKTLRPLIQKIIVLYVPWILTSVAKFRSPAKKILLIKIDAIGDYILFRDFIGTVKNSAAYNEYQIHLLANNTWKDLVVTYDQQFLDEIFYINSYDFYLSAVKLLKFGWKLFKNNYEVVLQPTSTRTLIHDALATMASPKKLIGFLSDNEGFANDYKQKLDKFYTEKLIFPPKDYFEFNRNLFFFSHALDEDIPITKPTLPVALPIVKKGVVVNIGAGVDKRRWEIDKFISLMSLILHNSDCMVYLCGPAHDSVHGHYIENKVSSDRLTNLIGKTSLTELVDLVNAAELVIGNETSIIHIAAAVDTPAICILGGGHFDRFMPYPSSVTDKVFCLYEKIHCYNCNWSCKYLTADATTYPCISNVQVQTVWNTTQNLLSCHLPK